MTNIEDPTTVEFVDVERYVGRWFEVGRLPLKWEDPEARDVTATYTLDEDGTIRVDNRCWDASGQPTQSVGEAKPVDESNAKLTVTFLPELLRWIPFTRGDYWILKLDDDYRHALVGTPDRKYLWLLSRQPDPDAEMVAQYLAEARAAHFDLSEWIETPQSGAWVTDAMLER